MIAVRNLSKRFDQVQALQQVSFVIPKGELCGLLGPNGAGKTTLFKIIMGMLAADEGEIQVAEQKIAFVEIEYKRRLGYSPESPVFYEYLTGSEFLAFVAAAKGLGQRAEGKEQWTRSKRQNAKGKRPATNDQRPRKMARIF